MESSWQGGTPGPPVQDKWLWNMLVNRVHQGEVIPIVGQELLNVIGTGQTVSPHTALVTGLAERLGLAGSGMDFASLSDVAAHYKRQGGKLKYVYLAFYEMLTTSSIPIPEPLLNLARIKELNLFVSTTCDNFLERALTQERCEPKIVAYQPKEDLSHADLNADLQSPRDFKQPLVFKLMGQASSEPFSYAITEEDTLEFVHALQSRERAPQNLLSLLDHNHLVIVGIGFSNWLARFFVRLVHSKRLLLASEDKDTFLVKGDAPDGQRLSDFLTQFSSTQLFNGGAAEFVTELYNTWCGLNPPPAPGSISINDPTRDPPPPPDPPTTGSIFVSYSRKDLPAAEAISKTLSANPMPVFFDKTSMEPGDWSEQIQESIRKCVMFVPILSRHTLTGIAHEFTHEWNTALGLLDSLPQNRQNIFMVPIVVDDTSPETVGGEFIPKRFYRYQWLNAVNGQLTPGDLERVKKCYRENLAMLRDPP